MFTVAAFSCPALSAKVAAYCLLDSTISCALNSSVNNNVNNNNQNNNQQNNCTFTAGDSV